MGQVQFMTFGIVSISIVIGGYLLAANHTSDVDRDARLEDLSRQVTELKAGLSSDNADALPLILDPPATGDSPQLLSVQAELSELRKELRALQMHQSRIQAEIDNVNYTSQIPNDEDEDPYEFEVEQQDTTMNASFEFENSFMYESPDPVWGMNAEQDIRSAITERSPQGVNVRSTECRSTVCRVEVEFDDAVAKMEGIPFLPMLIPWSGESYLQTDTDGDADSVVLYVAREGHSLTGESEASLE